MTEHKVLLRQIIEVGSVKLECTAGGKGGIPVVMSVKCGCPTVAIGDVPKL